MMHKPLRPQRGAAAIELALLLVFVLIPILFGITEIGRAMYQYDAVTKSARAASRHLIAHGSSSTTVQAEARCLAVYGVIATSCPERVDCPDPSWTPVVCGLGTNQVVIAEPSTTAALRNVVTSPGGGAIDIVTVTIGTANAPVQFQSLVPWIFPSVSFAPISAAMPQSF